jgi:hypothetical protein
VDKTAFCAGFLAHAQGKSRLLHSRNNPQACVHKIVYNLFAHVEKQKNKEKQAVFRLLKIVRSRANIGLQKNKPPPRQNRPRGLAAGR